VFGRVGADDAVTVEIVLPERRGRSARPSFKDRFFLADVSQRTLDGLSRRREDHPDRHERRRRHRRTLGRAVTRGAGHAHRDNRHGPSNDASAPATTPKATPSKP
jgi:hypothetical protein